MPNNKLILKRKEIKFARRGNFYDTTKDANVLQMGF